MFQISILMAFRLFFPFLSLLSFFTFFLLFFAKTFNYGWELEWKKRIHIDSVYLLVVSQIENILQVFFQDQYQQQGHPTILIFYARINLFLRTSISLDIFAKDQTV